MKIPDSDVALIKKNLVGRLDGAQFRYTRYAYTPMKLPLSELKLDKSKFDMEGFRTTPLLSLCGIYVHVDSKKVIVKCEGKTSFCIDGTNEYELEDVAFRSRSEALNAKRGVDYSDMTPEESMFDLADYFDDIRGYHLEDEIAKNEGYLFGGDQGVGECHVIPLLPVYLGYFDKNSMGMNVIDFSDDKGYKQKLRSLQNMSTIEFRMYQHVESSQIRIVGNGRFNREIHYCVRYALKYSINKETFMKRIVRYLQQEKYLGRIGYNMHGRRGVGEVNSNGCRDGRVEPLNDLLLGRRSTVGRGRSTQGRK